jgi:hypothetical protein
LRALRIAYHGVHGPTPRLRKYRTLGRLAQFTGASLSLGLYCETHVGMLVLVLIAFILFYFLPSFSSFFLLLQNALT